MALKLDTLLAGLEKETSLPWNNGKVKRSILNLFQKWNRYDRDDILSFLFSELCMKDIHATLDSGKDMGNAVYYAGDREMVRRWKMDNAQKRGGVGAHKMGEEVEEGEVSAPIVTVSLNAQNGDENTLEDMIGTDKEIGIFEAKDAVNYLHSLLSDKDKIILSCIIRDLPCREVGEIIGKSHEMARKDMERVKNRILRLRENVGY